MNLWILAAGGHGRVVADAATAAGAWENIGFLDDHYPELQRVGNWPVLGVMQDYCDAAAADEVVVALGDVTLRTQWMLRLTTHGLRLATVTHPRAVISQGAQIGAGSVVFANVVVNFGTTIGRYAILNTACTVDHDCHLGDGVHICPGAHVAGGVTIGDRSWVGIGASVMQGVSIGHDVVVGGGAAVVNDIPNQQKVVGVPAKPIGKSGWRSILGHGRIMRRMKLKR